MYQVHKILFSSFRGVALTKDPFLYFTCRSILCILPVVFTFWYPLCFWLVDPTFVFYLRFLSCTGILNVHTSFVFYLCISRLYFSGRSFLCIYDFTCKFLLQLFFFHTDHMHCDPNWKLKKWKKKWAKSNTPHPKFESEIPTNMHIHTVYVCPWYLQFHNILLTSFRGEMCWQTVSVVYMYI